MQYPRAVFTPCRLIFFFLASFIAKIKCIYCCSPTTSCALKLITGHDWLCRVPFKNLNLSRFMCIFQKGFEHFDNLGSLGGLEALN
jgi:hypothetical protein